MRARNVAAILGVSLASCPTVLLAETLYRLTEIGTLGGNYVSVQDMNAKGQLTGWSITSDGSRHAFLWDGRNLIDLGTLGGNESQGDRINNSGEVAGSSTFRADGVATHAFLWSGLQMLDLGSLGRNYGYVRGINSSGQVAGIACHSGPVEEEPCTALVWDGAATRQPRPDSAGQSYGIDIDATGRVLINQLISDENYYPLLWASGHVRNIPTLGGEDAYGVDVNASGQVAGSSQVPNDALYHAFFWDGSVTRDLGTLDARGSFAHALNDRGQVTGYLYFHEELHHAFVWDGAQMHDINPSGSDDSHALAINALGHVTGYYYVAAQDRNLAFLWDGNRSSNLNDRIDPQDPLRPHVVLNEGVDINKRGQVAANGRDSRVVGFGQRGYVVTPLEYQVAFVGPAKNSSWKRTSRIPVKIALVDNAGKRITDARAKSLIGTPCKVKFSANGAQDRSPACMGYNEATNEFYFNWIPGATAEPGVTTLRGAASYKFSMPQAVTTTRSRSITITP